MEYLLIKRISSQVITSGNASPSKLAEEDVSKANIIETSEASTQVVEHETELNSSYDSVPQIVEEDARKVRILETSEASTQVIEHEIEAKSIEDSMSETESFINGKEIAVKGSGIGIEEIWCDYC